MWSIFNWYIPHIFEPTNKMHLWQWYLSMIYLIFLFFIRVGAGTAGSVLAARLSESKNNTVLLIEAGSFFNTLSSVPLLATLFQLSKYDWQFKTTRQRWSSKGLENKKSFWPRGKGVGGSGQINFMVHGLLDLKDLDHWTKLGAYSLANLKRFHNDHYEVDYNYNASTCSYQKYLFNQFYSHSDYSKFSSTRKDKLLTQENKKLSVILEKAIHEINENFTFIPISSSIKNGMRWSSYNSHLYPSLERPNLDILCNSLATKVLFRNKTAIGVRIMSNDFIHDIYSTTEVILAAGAINSPKLLMLSGIGDRPKLLRKSIPVVHHLPGVGKNLFDHLSIPIYVSLRKPISLTLNKILNIEVFWKYITTGEGALGESPVAGMAYSSRKMSVVLFGMGSADEVLLKKMANFKTQVFRNIFPFHNNRSQEGFTFLVVCPQPKSRGAVSLKNNNPLSEPFIDPRYLSAHEDITCTEKGIEVAMKLANSEEFRKYGAKVHYWPESRRCKNQSYHECLIKHVGITMYHPGGTCKMGLEKDILAVVDNDFKVIGMDKLRIVDASVVPAPVSIFPNSILIAIAEYASSLLKR